MAPSAPPNSWSRSGSISATAAHKRDERRVFALQHIDRLPVARAQLDDRPAAAHLHSPPVGPMFLPSHQRVDGDRRSQRDPNQLAAGAAWAAPAAGFSCAHATILLESCITEPSSVTSTGTHCRPVRRLTSRLPAVLLKIAGSTPSPYERITSG